MDYSKLTIENKRNFFLHIGDLVEKCDHSQQTGSQREATNNPQSQLLLLRAILAHSNSALWTIR